MRRTDMRRFPLRGMRHRNRVGTRSPAATSTPRRWLPGCSSALPPPKPPCVLSHGGRHWEIGDSSPGGARGKQINEGDLRAQVKRKNNAKITRLNANNNAKITRDLPYVYFSWIDTGGVSLSFCSVSPQSKRASLGLRGTLLRYFNANLLQKSRSRRTFLSG